MDRKGANTTRGSEKPPRELPRLDSVRRLKLGAVMHFVPVGDMRKGGYGGGIGCEVGARAHEFLKRAHRVLFIFRIILFCLLKVFQRWERRRAGGDRRTAALPYPTQMVGAVGSAGTSAAELAEFLPDAKDSKVLRAAKILVGELTSVDLAEDGVAETERNREQNARRGRSRFFDKRCALR